MVEALTDIHSSGRNYEDLDGGVGKEIFFRPQRYGREDLGLIRPAVVVEIDSQPTRYELHDVSQNGVAFFLDSTAPPDVGTVLATLSVTFDTYEAYRGAARVESVRDQDGRALVGASFLDSLMDIPDVLQLRDVRSWHATDRPDMGLASRPWHTPSHDRFKSLVAEFRLFLEDASTELSELEANLPWEVVHATAQSTARFALIDRIRTEFVPVFLQFAEDLDDALRLAEGDDWDALKVFSLRYLQDYLMRAPFAHRARFKPLGYPGDYECMRDLYQRHFEGSTLFARALHLGIVNMPGGQAVRARKNLIKAKLKELIESRNGSAKPVRIASIAAGPAQETYELLAEMSAPVRPVELVLFEQDPHALAYSQGRLAQLAERKWGGAVRLIFLRDSIKRLLTDPTLFRGLGPFDMIFCAGLFDYLQDHTAAKLTRTFYANLAPGGSAYIGNMMPNMPTRWFMEHHLEWYLIYRTHEEMLSFARAGAPSADLSIAEESTRVNPFLRVTRA